jgi:hypothetical protein
MLENISTESEFFREIGPVIYVDNPCDVAPVFAQNPKTGIVIVNTSLSPEVIKELPNIHRLADQHSSRVAFNKACQNTYLKRWLEEQTQELGSAYPDVLLNRASDVWETWHVDLMNGRRRCLLQIDGAGLRIANPESVMRLAFNNVRKNQPLCPLGVDLDENLRRQGISILTLRQGQMAVFGDFGLHASGNGPKLRGIAY